MTVIEAPAVGDQSPTALIRPLPEHRPPAVDRVRLPLSATAPLPLPERTLITAGPAAVARTAAPGDGLDPRLRAQLQGLAAAIVDTLAGRRPPQQLIRWVDERVLSDLVLRSRLHRHQGRVVSVRSVRLQRSADRVEASLRIGDEQRCEALALRFDRLGGRWVCTTADFGPGESAQPRLV